MRAGSGDGRQRVRADDRHREAGAGPDAPKARLYPYMTG